MKLPLPPNFFKCPPLSTDEVERLKQQAYATAMDVVQKSLVQSASPSNRSGVSWTLASNDHGLQIYRGTVNAGGAGASDQLKLSVGVAEVAGTIDEVVALFRNDTTELTKEYVHRFGRGLLDSANLYTLVEPTRSHPNESVSINWMALKSPLKQVILERDCCYLEGHYEFEVHGKRGWVRSLKSVNLMCCPDMQHALGLVRMVQVGTGHAFVESDRPGYMRIAYVVHADFRGAAPDWAIDVAIKRRCKSLLDIDTFLRENRLAQGHFLTSSQVVSKHLRRRCFLCQKKLHGGLGFTKKLNCVKCGEVFCNSCSHPWTVRVCGIPTRIDACAKCALAAPTPTKALLFNQFDSSDTHSLSFKSSYSSQRSHHQQSHSDVHIVTSTRSKDKEGRFCPSDSSRSSSSIHSSHSVEALYYPRFEEVTTPPTFSQHKQVSKDTWTNEMWIQDLIANTSSLLQVTSPTKSKQDHAKYIEMKPTPLDPISRPQDTRRQAGAAPEDEVEPGSIHATNNHMHSLSSTHYSSRGGSSSTTNALQRSLATTSPSVLK
ncbi:hypothetical protein DYB34_006714 [Aphanomyces astaci]|uniref:START domain-containing protein n=1 Tax=Aphanomyces astaci TaxID=112090 RepID=A0A3R6ZTI6_APHAT|nr:hypothetical protein DYB34_006714 [Aphanomyces astaci]